MTAPSATRLYHEHAKVSNELGENDKALASYKAALRQPIAAILKAAQSGSSTCGEVEGTLIVDFSHFCATLDYAEEIKIIRNKLRQARENDAISDSLKLKIDALLLKLMDCSEGVENVQREFEKAIESTIESHGLRSQAVQNLFVEYSQFLHRMGADSELEEVIIRRLREVSPDYRETLGDDRRVEKISRLYNRVIRRLQNINVLSNKAQKLKANADRVYSEGDVERAFHLHNQAAQMGHLDSIFTLGTYFQLGLGCDEDMIRAREHYLHAAKKGHAGSQQHYGALLQMGLGGEADIQSAVYWYQRAAAKDHIPALKNLAAIYGSGLLGQHNYAACIETYLKAYLLGDAPSFDQVIYYFNLPIDSL